jgi:hypothetical protein
MIGAALASDLNVKHQTSIRLEIGKQGSIIAGASATKRKRIMRCRTKRRSLGEFFPSAENEDKNLR